MFKKLWKLNNNWKIIQTENEIWNSFYKQELYSRGNLVKLWQKIGQHLVITLSTALLIPENVIDLELKSPVIGQKLKDTPRIFIYENEILKF